MENFKFTGFVRAYSKKDGGSFTALKIKGRYLPKAIQHKTDIKEDEYYSIRVVGGAIPTSEGKFAATCSEGWVDERDASKLIVRLRLVSAWEKVGELPTASN